MVEDDENSLDATNDAFELLHTIAETRLKRRKLVVVDATNVRKEDRAQLVRVARKHHALAVAIVLNPGEDICHDRNRARPDRQFGSHVVRNHMASLRRNMRRIDKEGFRYVHELRSIEEIDKVEIARERLWTDARHKDGPFDIIGDVHGCADELEALLAKLGYLVSWLGDGEERACTVIPPQGRRAIFVGDLVDRGPRTPDVLRLVHAMVASGAAFCVPGNHDVKLIRWLNGRNVKLTHGLAESAAQLEQESPRFRERMKAFLDGLISHLWLDGGRLVVAHAGIKEDMIGRSSGAVREFCLYGETKGGDRRVRLAHPLQLGRRVPGQHRARLWPHARCRCRVAEQHHLPRHRLRLRRQAHGAALAGEGSRRCSGRQGLCRAGPAAGRRCHGWPQPPARQRRCVGPVAGDRQAHRRYRRVRWLRALDHH
jgi:protein phosphatase